MRGSCLIITCVWSVILTAKMPSWHVPDLGLWPTAEHGAEALHFGATTGARRHTLQAVWSSRSSWPSCLVSNSEVLNLGICVAGHILDAFCKTVTKPLCPVGTAFWAVGNKRSTELDVLKVVAALFTASMFMGAEQCLAYGRCNRTVHSVSIVRTPLWL